jgi:hypothetical protein
MANTTTATCLPLFPSLEMAWRDVDSSFERFCLTAGIGALEQMLREDAQQLPARRTVAAEAASATAGARRRAKAALAILASARRGGFRHTFIFSWCVDAPARAECRSAFWCCRNRSWRAVAQHSAAAPLSVLLRIDSKRKPRATEARDGGVVSCPLTQDNGAGWIRFRGQSTTRVA